MVSNAKFSKCGKYRYCLSRIWNKKLPVGMFIGLNPSTADETENDPTVRRCIAFAESWGWGGFYLCNLFAFRATDPTVMKQESHPVGPVNNLWLKKVSLKASLVIAIWGNHGTFNGRSSAARKLFPKIHCLKQNKTGEPTHPLYLKGTLRPFQMDATD